MASLRIVYDNAADRAAQLSASSTAGDMHISNVQNEYKGKAHRSVGTAVTYTITWNSPELIRAVILPATNLSLAAKVRVRCYTDVAGVELISDTGEQLACPAASYNVYQWPTGLSVNTFAYGGLSKAAVWLTSAVYARKCEITIADPTNSAGFIDCSRIVCGNYWAPQYNFQKGASVDTIDTSEVTRTASGSLVSERKFMHDSLKFNFSILTVEDRAALKTIIKVIGAHKNFVLSLLPMESDKSIVEDTLIYGKRSNSPFTLDYYKYYGHSMEIEGW